MVDTIGFANSAPTTTTLTYNARQARQLNGVAFAGAKSGRPLGALTGVRPGTSATTVTATSTTWTCGAFAGLADVMTANESGAYPFSFDAATSPSAFTPNNATLPRQDIIVVTVTDPENGSTTPTVTRAYVAGTVNVAGTLTAVVPAQSFTIAVLNMPAVSGAPSVTWVAPYTVAAGGIAPFNTKALLDAWTTAPAGQVSVVTADTTVANNGLYVWSSAASVWLRTGGSALRGDVYVPAANATVLATSFGDVSLATLTRTSGGGRVHVSARGTIINAGSGAARTANLQLLCDGVLVGEVSPTLLIPFLSGSTGQAFIIEAFHTPTAASHVWKLQGTASSASAVAVSNTTLVVEETF